MALTLLVVLAGVALMVAAVVCLWGAWAALAAGAVLVSVGVLADLEKAA